MASNNRVFVSPGVYTSEVDLTFVAQSVGVTTLGLVGETTIGPAFQPIFISNYGEFQSFFGGLNATKIKEQGANEIFAMSVNDPFVVTAFAEKLGAKDHISFIADGNGEFTKALGLELDLSVA